MLETNSCQQLLDRGDHASRAGDIGAAASFYRAALQVARMHPPTELVTRGRLNAAESYVLERAAEFRNKLGEVADRFQGESLSEHTRFIHSLDMLRGTRQIFTQQPQVFYYPYLPHRQFFEREEFAWVEELEAVAPMIREELNRLIRDGVKFHPYVEDETNRPTRQFHHLNNDLSWTALYLWRDSQPIREIAERCPKTMEALRRVPMSNIGRRTPSALFSRLEPGAHIPPHTGLLNCRLICHLPLIVPEGCTLRVGNETREWHADKLLIFDDSIEHEARNPTDELRVILLFDIWRPELALSEREGISSIFQAIDEFQALPEA